MTLRVKGKNFDQNHSIFYAFPDICELLMLIANLVKISYLYTNPLSKVIGMHPYIKFHFFAGDTQFFVNMFHKNVALAFDKLNSCLLDVQEWILSSMLKLNPDKTEFIIFGSHAQLKKLDPYLPIRIFGNFIHPVAV